MVPGLAEALDPELQLKVEKQLRMAPARPERDSAKFLEAERIEGQQDKSVTATGNVVLRQRGATIRADRLEYFAEVRNLRGLRVHPYLRCGLARWSSASRCRDLVEHLFGHRILLSERWIER